MRKGKSGHFEGDEEREREREERERGKILNSSEKINAHS